jgi:hypothetical protein
MSTIALAAHTSILTTGGRGNHKLNHGSGIFVSGTAEVSSPR